MKLEVGNYVRTIDGFLWKPKKIEIDEDGCYLFDDYYYFEPEQIYKSSNNIKDLIEVGDIITYEFPTGLGMLRYENVTVLEDLLNILKSSDEYKILTIITREQIESMQYKVD